METATQVLMIRPVKFAMNPETCHTNAFQKPTHQTNDEVHQKSSEQFDNFVKLLKDNGVDVTVIDDTVEPHTPDSIFPNNWITFYHNGICLHSMENMNRRAERKPHVLSALREKFLISETVDLTASEAKHQYLEGTGSVILDRKNRIAYGCLSSRTHRAEFENYCNLFNFKGICFNAVDSNNVPIYHTNVMLSVADRYVIVCLDAVRDENQRRELLKSFHESSKSVISISLDQMNNFAANVLQLQNGITGEKVLVMSTRAFNSLTGDQIATISKFNKIIHENVDVIENNGGGGVRCMMAEIFLTLK
ncbi:uncharacterized protein LOC119074282 [Bradysia coprophila]|uniref:uncharacterized protein LOC119074282 n=1 Tax=Bradysia coprophila TaxID=38358 RepID=UPI00187DCF1D|nr:uncharacterized protein LOC119074282 [Bradysia coprophila]